MTTWQWIVIAFYCACILFECLYIIGVSLSRRLLGAIISQINSPLCVQFHLKQQTRHGNVSRG